MWLISINGMVVARVLESSVEIEARVGRIVKGGLKEHVLKKLPKLNLAEATIYVKSSVRPKNNHLKKLS